MSTKLLVPTAFACVLLTGAIFGFFYAWVCSTMWGLDEADPRTAIAAMQAMNASVRNPVFFPAFFLTPVVAAAAAYAAHRAGMTKPAVFFMASAILYVVGAFLPTVLVNVPMNEALALVAIPESTTEAGAIWQEYSAPWQFWNQLRTIASAGSLMLVAAGLYGLRRHEVNRPR